MTVDTQAYLPRAILECPDDDLPRLAYADWLTEQGDGHSLERAYDVRNNVRYPNCFTSHTRASPRHLYYTFPEDPITEWGCSELLPAYCNAGCSHRGFLYSVEISLADWNSHAEELFRSHPLRKVYLTGKEPYKYASANSGCHWYEEEFRREEEGGGTGPLVHEESNLPGWLYDRLQDGTPITSRRYRHYLSPLQATNDLSNALVKLGREMAGLPPIARLLVQHNNAQPWPRTGG